MQGGTSVMCPHCAEIQKSALFNIVELPNGCYWGQKSQNIAYGTLFNKNHNEVHYGLMQGEIKAIALALTGKAKGK